MSTVITVDERDPQSIRAGVRQLNAMLAAYQPDACARPSAVPATAEVSALALSKAGSDRLRRLGITTVGELCSFTETELRIMRNVGDGVIADIKAALSAAGLALHPARQLAVGLTARQSVARLGLPGLLSRWLTQVGYRTVGQLTRAVRDERLRNRLGGYELERYLRDTLAAGGYLP